MSVIKETSLGLKAEKKWIFSFFSLIIFIWTLIVLTHYSGYSFWGDEMGTISIANPIHCPAVILYFVLFIADLYLFLKKKNSIKHIIPYLIWGVLFLPCLMYAYFKVKSYISDYWSSSPTLRDFFLIVPELLKNPLLIIFWYSSIFWLFIRLTQVLRKKEDFLRSGYFPAFLMYWLVLAYRTVNFLYSTINSNYSMWVSRYFLCLLPCIVMFIGFMLSDIIPLIFSKLQSTAVKTVITTILLIGAAYLEMSFIQACKAERHPEIERQPFEQAAEILRTMDDLYEPDTAVYYSAHNIEAWQYYLAHGDMTPGLINLLPKRLTEADIQPYNIIYVMIVQDAIPQETDELFSKYFDKEEIHHDYRIYKLIRK